MSDSRHGFGRRLVLAVLTVCGVALASYFTGFFYSFTELAGSNIRVTFDTVHPLAGNTTDRVDVQNTKHTKPVLVEVGTQTVDDSNSGDKHGTLEKGTEHSHASSKDVTSFTPKSPIIHASADNNTNSVRVIEEHESEDYYDPYEDSEEDEVPHVDECNLCFLCHKNKPSSRSRKIDPDIRAHTAQLEDINEASVISNLDPEADFKVFRTHGKSQRPNCTECYGCTDHLEYINRTITFLGANLKFENGASPVWVLRVKDGPMAKRSRTGEAVVKVWCVPVRKALQRGFQECNPANRLKSPQTLTALDTLVEECGFEDIVPRSWIGPVNGILNGTGYHINWDGLWMEPAPGASVEMFLQTGHPQASSEKKLELLNKVNSTQVKMAAIFDLLFSQCDRHAQNVFIDEQGKLTLIDNDNSLQFLMKNCGVDSMFLPTTEKYAINQQTFAFIKQHTDKPPPQPNIQLLLDYRCHVKDRKIGFDYPIRTKKCMKKFARMTVDDLMKTYGIPEIRSAQALKDRSQAMIKHGFEKALEDSEPYNPPDKRYPWFTPCCTFKAKKGYPTFQCNNPYWHPNKQRPPLL